MDVLTITEASALAGVTPRQLRHAITSGKLRARVIGRAYTIQRADLDAWQPPAPGASLDAYWRARGKRGSKATLTAGGTPDDPHGGGGVGSFTARDPRYAPALVRMRDGSTTPAEVILDGSGAPDEVIDFGLFKAGYAGLGSGGAFIYTEIA